MSAEDGRPYGAEAGGVRLAIRITPRARRNALDGVVRKPDGRTALHLRVAAAPVEGAANAALIAFLADALGLRKSDIRIRSGETARLKVVVIAGDAEAIMARLAAWVAQAGG